MLLVLAFSSTTLWYVQKDEALPGPGTAYVVNNAPPTTQAAFAPNTVYVGTIQPNGPVAPPIAHVSYGQHPQVAAYNQYSQQHQVAQATAVPVEYTKTV
jgi:hypothetical protein